MYNDLQFVTLRIYLYTTNQKHTVITGITHLIQKEVTKYSIVQFTPSPYAKIILHFVLTRSDQLNEEFLIAP